MDERISFEDIMATLDKDTKSKVKIGSEISRQIMPTASYNLNKTLGGGFRKGKQHTLWGGEQSAKTGFMLQTAGINQRLGENIAWIDAEHSFDPEWAWKLGCDPDKIALSSISTIGELTDLQVSLIKAGFDMIVIDSTGALMPKSYVDKEGELKPFAETAQLGAVAKDLGQMCKMVQGINYTCAVVHISQARIDVGSPAQTKPMKPIGGKETEHTDSLRIRLFSSKAEANAIMGNSQRGMNLVQEKHGIPVDWKIDKNKLNGRYGTGKYDFFIGGDHLGLDLYGEILDTAVTFGVVDKGGAWYTIFGERKQGRVNAVKYLRENEDIFTKIQNELDSLDTVVEASEPDEQSV
jgi:recombination protein RecA